MEAPLYIAILAGQSNMSGRGGVHTSANGTRQWDGVTPPEANAQAGACPAHRRLLPQFHQVCIFQDGVPCTLQAPCCAGVPPARGRTPQSRCTMTLTWGEPFVPATHIYKDGHDMCHTVLSFAAIEHLCATTCACAWSTYQLQGLQSWWSCQAVDGPHTHLRVLGRKACGVGPGLVFAAHLLRSGGAQRMGLVPCAVGGTAMDRWVPGADLYEQMARPLHPKSDADMSAPGQPALRTHVPEAPRLHMRMPSRAVQPQAGQSYAVWTSQASICQVAATLVSLQARARVPGHRIHSDACFGCMRPAPLWGGCNEHGWARPAGEQSAKCCGRSARAGEPARAAVVPGARYCLSACLCRDCGYLPELRVPAASKLDMRSAAARVSHIRPVRTA